jgi:hypothetical protein
MPVDEMSVDEFDYHPSTQCFGGPSDREADITENAMK